MVANVVIGGKWIGSMHAVSGLQDSTVFRMVGWSGDYELSCSWSAPPHFSAPWFRRGASVRVVESGITTWGGFLSEPEASDDGWSLHAYGYGAQAEMYVATSGVPNTAVDQAAASPRFMQMRRGNAVIGTTSVNAVPGDFISVAEVLDRAAAQAGAPWYVDSGGYVTLKALGNTPTWVLRPDATYIQSADDNYFTHISGYYATAVDSNGAPTAYAYSNFVGNATAALIFGRREVVVDLTALGVISSSVNAEAQVAGRLSALGGRVTYTGAVDVTAANLRHIRGGMASPMSLRAGQVVRVPGVSDISQGVYRPAANVLIGEARRFHDQGRTQVLPFGFVERDFTAALAAAQPPTPLEVK